MDLNVHIHAYDDLDQLQNCVQSVREVLGPVSIHVFDGRYCTFPGESDTTPGLESYCQDQDTVHYYAPADYDLPFGHTLTAPTDHRPGVYAKSLWAVEKLPADEWTLKLDTDERLERFDVDTDELHPKKKYALEINRPEDPAGDPQITRLYVPCAWTPWLDDSLLPRDLFPRTQSLDVLQRVWRDDAYRAIRFLHRRTIDPEYVDILNVGHDRPREYRERRAAHLDRIGRSDRHAELSL